MPTNDKIRHTPRMYVPSRLANGTTVPLAQEQNHYLLHVLRAKTGDHVRLFNGEDGEWLAVVAAIGKKTVDLTVSEKLRDLVRADNLWLCPAPIKKAHFDYMLEKATELGVSGVQPFLSERTQLRDLNLDRCRSIATESAEQSERLDIPEIKPLLSFADFIASWPKDRLPIVCAELGPAEPPRVLLGNPAFAERAGSGKVGIITGPEGGFSDKEFEIFRSLPSAVFLRLGPRILRADTAAVAALTLWQAFRGDWR